MAKAVFKKPFDYTDHTRGMSIHVPASSDEVTLTEEVVAAAIAAGVAERVGSEPARTATAHESGTVEYTGKKEDASAVHEKSEEAAQKAAGSTAAPTTTANPTGKTGSTSTTT